MTIASVTNVMRNTTCLDAMMQGAYRWHDKRQQFVDTTIEPRPRRYMMTGDKAKDQRALDTAISGDLFVMPDGSAFEIGDDT